MKRFSTHTPWVVGAALLLVALIPLILSARPPERGAHTPPNIVLIMTDDQGWGDVRSHGNPEIDTPAMDQLAQEGVRFERFFVSPVCAPTRASLLTGRYFLRTGTHGVTRGYETMRSEEVTLAEAFRQAGYATGIFGKWHNGAHYPHDPNGQGFDEFLGFSAGHWNNYFDTHLVHNGRRVETEGYIADVLTDAAMTFIEQHKDNPFFVYLPYNTPHSPFQVPDRYFDKYKQRGFDDKNATVYGMVENIDDNLGRILDQLDALGLSDDTIVLFLTDNGPNGRDRYNGDMRGAKASVHEGGVRVPLFIRWPGHLDAGRVVRQIAAHIDLFPTLIDLTGVPMPETLPLDGVSLAPLLKGEARDWPDRMLFTHWRLDAGSQIAPGAVRTTRWRAVVTEEGWQLYDMLNDPGQHTDVAAAYPAVTKQLAALYAAWFAEVTEAGFDPILTHLGHPERPEVVLPGHEAFLHPAPGDGISYVGRNGWANDWVTNWTSLDAYPAWPVEVVQPGRYEVTLMVACAEEDLGARFQVEIGGQQLEGVVTIAHDPPYTFSPDRVLRGEVYEKQWMPLTLGAVDLEPGPTQLAVKALDMPGNRMMDLKAVRVRRVD
ncbi:MAG: arylsulfatase [Bacteroidetes bacterium]|nr:arylsulfatase [Bacteroidota bacterium]